MPEHGPRVPKSPEEGNGLLRKIGMYLGRWKSATALTLLLLLGAVIGTKKGGAEEGLEPTRQPSIVTTKEEKSGQTERGLEFRINLTFVRVGPDGQLEWALDNPILKLLFPVISRLEIYQGEFGKVGVVTIPYHYARFFDSAKPLDPEDHKKLSEYINQRLSEEFAKRVIDLGFGIGQRLDPESEKEKISKIGIKSIHIVGRASPEGPQEKGPSTLEIGAIDEENIKLAELRAQVGGELTLEELKKLGVDLKNIPQISYKGEEVQFTEKEFEELEKLASKLGYPNVFELIIDYNDNKIQDEEALNILDRIVASKRGIEVHIEYNDGEVTKILIPIPLLPLLLLFFRRRRRLSEIIPEESILPSESTPSLGEGPQLSEIPKLEAIPINVSDLQHWGKLLSEIPPDEYESMKWQALINDLYRFFDDPDTIRRGLSYRAITEAIVRDYDRFSNKEELELAVAYLILEKWREHDIKARQEAGISEEKLEIGLDYINQPNQIRWALIHARLLIQLAEIRRVELKEMEEGTRRVLRDYIEIIEEMINKENISS